MDTQRIPLSQHRDRRSPAGWEVARSLRFADFSNIPPIKFMGGTVRLWGTQPTGTTENAEFAEFGVLIVHNS